MSDSVELIDTYQNDIVIKIISLSESSDESVRNMESRLDGINFIYSNSEENLRDVLKNTDMVFLIGIADDIKTKEIAEISLESDTLIIAVVTTAIQFEIGKIIQLICSAEGGNTINEILLESVRGITDNLVIPATINVGFGDIKTIITYEKQAFINVSSAMGKNRARKAAQQVLIPQLLLESPKGVFIWISSASAIDLAEFNEVADVVSPFLSDDSIIKIGMAIEPELGDAIKITIVAAGFDNFTQIDYIKNPLTGFCFLSSDSIH
jgi:cell division GTPase FtsZ